jgi:hypothetical protein
MKELTADIDLDHEVAAVASFISLKWTSISNVQALVTDIRASAERIGRPLFDHFQLWSKARELRKERIEMLEQTLGSSRPDVSSSDAICSLLDSVMTTSNDISDAGRHLLGAWDIIATAKALQTTLVDRYPDLASARPRGWAELEQGYIDFAGQEEYDPTQDRELFAGARVQGARSDDFPGRIALPYVLYDERCRGLNASVSLISAVLAHFLGITEFLNSVRLVRDLPLALPQVSEPVMLFERKVSTDNPFLKVAFELAPPCRTRADFEETLKRQAAFDALSDEEKERRRGRRGKVIERLMESLKGPISDEDQKKQADEKARCATLLSAALNI